MGRILRKRKLFSAHYAVIERPFRRTAGNGHCLAQRPSPPTLGRFLAVTNEVRDTSPDEPNRAKVMFPAHNLRTVAATPYTVRATAFIAAVGEDAFLVLSEPLVDLPDAWEEIPESMAIVARRGSITQHAFSPRGQT
jgi:hypothetical protein